MQVYLEGPNYQNPMIFSNENAIHSLRFFNKTKAASFLKQISSGIPFNWFSHQILERLVLGVWCLVPQASPSEKLGNCKLPNSSLVMHSCSRLTADTLQGSVRAKSSVPTHDSWLYRWDMDETFQRNVLCDFFETGKRLKSISKRPNPSIPQLESRWEVLDEIVVRVSFFFLEVMFLELSL